MRVGVTLHLLLDFLVNFPFDPFPMTTVARPDGKFVLLSFDEDDYAANPLFGLEKAAIFAYLIHDNNLAFYMRKTWKNLKTKLAML